MFWVTRTLICAAAIVIGWIVGVVLARIMFAFDNWRLDRAWKRREVTPRTVADFRN